MIYTARGIKSLIISLVVIALIILFLFFLFNLILFLIPLVLVLIILGYFFKVINKFKKEKPKDFVDIKYKIKR